MTSRAVSLVFAVSALAALSSCSKSQQGEQAARSFDAAEAPDIAPTAAPGVAFNYAYQFNLPDERIRGVQEAHAAACEKLGVERCRITGLEYSVNEDEMVRASLTVKLEPTIARAFGKDAIATVEQNEGKLRNLAITGEDQQPHIRANQSEKDTLVEQRASLQKQLSGGGLKASQRIELQQQINQLEQQISAAQASINVSNEKLANTPMTFDYYGRGGAPGFRNNPIRESWNLLVSTVVTVVQFVLDALAVLVPIGLLLALLIALWRTRPIAAMRRWLRPVESEE